MRLLLLGNLLGSTTPLLFAYVDAPGVWPAGMAMAIAGLALGLFAGVSGRARELVAAAQTPGVWIVGALLGAVTCAIASSVSFTTLVVATFLAQLTPVATIALAPLFGEPTTWSDKVAVLFAVAGAAFLASSRSGGDHRSHLIGASLALFGAVGSAVVLQAQRRFAVGSIPVIPTQAVTLFVGGLVVLPFGHPPEATPRRIGLVLAISGIFAAANLLLFYGLRTVRASRAVTVRPFAALFAVVAGPLALHQTLDGSAALGAALSIGATAIAGLQHARSRRSPFRGRGAVPR